MQKSTSLLLIGFWLNLLSLLSVNLGVSGGTPPRIDKHPFNVIVNVSDPVTLECRATGDPKPKITWYKDGQMLNIMRSETDLIGVGGGVGIAGASSASAVAVGFQIPYTNNANKYTLIHDSNLFIISASLGKGNKSDTGTYNCKAKNEFGEAVSSNATLLITYLKDDFREMPKSRQVNAGSLVTMECKAPKGSPEPIIWWEKNGVQLKLPQQQQQHYSHQKNYNNIDLSTSNTLAYYSFTNGTFIITNASVIDNGEYVCVAKNDAGIKKSAPAYLNVFEKPSFLIQPETAKYQANTKVELECQANGFPKPLIEWKKDGSIENLPLKAQIRDNTLIIPNVQLDDEGEYTCLASNQLASIEAKAYVVVYEKPMFTKTMSNLTIGIESKSITLECNARGKPQPVIYWAKSGDSYKQTKQQNSAAGTGNGNGGGGGGGSGGVSGQDDFIILENGNLFIERLSKRYEGTYLCQASNEYGNIETKTYLQVKAIQSKPPPIILYGPQNQTIPINTQATLECTTRTASNIIFNVDSIESQSQQMQFGSGGGGGSNDKIFITWFKGSQQINTINYFETNKYRLLDSGSLEINSVQKSDSGVYKCVASNGYGQTSSIPAYLNVENPNNQYVEFQRNYETTALPSAPTQPIVLLTGAQSVSLSWQPSSHSGHSTLRSYTIEYFSPEWPTNSPGWTILAENIPPISSYTVENLQADTYYMFIVRARNDQGYGPPSPVSDLVKTLFEPQSIFRNKNSNEILEKALTGEVVQLNEPADVLSSTSINITWKILKSANLIEGFYVKYKPIGSKDYLIDTLNDNKRSYHVLHNLHKFTPYEILVEPFSGSISGSESNIVQAKTLDDMPTQSPINLNVELESRNSISIKWQPPPLNHMNGVITGYKISCLANETRYNLNLNTNATTRAIILGNLVEGMKYCVKVAAFTKKGIGPFTTAKCVEMSAEKILPKQTQIQTNNQQRTTFNDKLKDIITEPWFISIIVLVSLAIIAVLFYCVWFMSRRISLKQKQHKYLSTSSENGSLNVPHKIDNGNRYKLVNDTIWLDTLHSSSNNSNQECCCVPDLHHQIFVQPNPVTGNIHIIHDLNNPLSSLEKQRIQSLSIKSKFTPINPADVNSNNNNSNNNNNNSTSSASSSSNAPQYAEIYGPSIQQLQQQIQSTNPYATTGLFMNGQANNSSESDNQHNTNGGVGNNVNNHYNIINYQSVSNLANNLRTIPNVLDSNGNLKYSSYTIKMLSDKLSNQNESDLAAATTIAASMADQKKLLKYLQATQSQTNTPRVPVKNLQNRVKSVENQQYQQQHLNCCNINADHHQQQQPHYDLHQNQSSYLTSTNNNNGNGNNNLHHLHLHHQLHLNNQNIPSLPLPPPPPPQQQQQIPIGGSMSMNSQSTQHQMISYLSDNNHHDSLTNEAIRNFLDMIPTSNNNNNNNQISTNGILINTANQHQLSQQQQQPPAPNSSSTPIPSLPLAPPPSLASALLAQQQQHNQQHNQQIIDGYNLVTASTMARTTHSPVQYNSPWNVNLADQATSSSSSNPTNSNLINNNQTTNNPNSVFVSRLINNNNQSSNSKSNSSSIISNLTGNSTLSRGLTSINSSNLNTTNSNSNGTRNSPIRTTNCSLNHQLSSTFTAQQYANRTLSQKQQIQLQIQQQQQQQHQQDYSSISPDDEINENELNYQQHQHQHQQLLKQRNQRPNQNLNQILNGQQPIGQISHENNINNDQQPISLNMVQSWASCTDTASTNPISSSYDSPNPNSLSTSSNSSDMSSKRSSRSEDDLPTVIQQQQQQNYPNHIQDPSQQQSAAILKSSYLNNDDNKKKFIPILQTAVIDTNSISSSSNSTQNTKHYLISDDPNEIYNEMPQTIL